MLRKQIAAGQEASVRGRRTGLIVVIEAEVVHRPEDGYVLVRVGGEIDTATQGQLTEALDQALAAGPAAVMIDLCTVRFFSAAGVHCLDRAVAALRVRGGTVRLVCLNPGPVWRIFCLLGLDRQWPVHHDVAGAVVSLASRSG